MGTGKKKRSQYPKRNEKLGTGKKKRRQYPKENEKLTPVPKEKNKTGYRKEKMTPVPKEKRKTGYRKEKIRRTKSYFWVMCKRRKYVMLKVKKWVNTRQKRKEGRIVLKEKENVWQPCFWQSDFFCRIYR